MSSQLRKVQAAPFITRRSFRVETSRPVSYIRYVKLKPLLSETDSEYELVQIISPEPNFTYGIVIVLERSNISKSNYQILGSKDINRIAHFLKAEEKCTLLKLVVLKS